MPHQDNDDLRTPVQDLKSLFELLPVDQLRDQPRHGNAIISASVLAITAIIAFGWTKKDALTERFQTARDAASRMFPNMAIATTRQGLFSALAQCGNQLLSRIRAALIQRLKHESCWLLVGRPTFAVDGSQFAVPRSLKNLSFFAAASRKSKGTYKTDADLKKASTTQIAVSLCQHLGSGLPFAWNRGGSADSERSLLLNMLDRLPAGSRLVMDAYYFGYEFWKQLIEGGFTFVVRAGKNIDVLKVLKATGKVKYRNGLVLYWPQTAIDRDAKPIVLRLVEVMVGRKRMFLLTNELELTDQQLSEIYAARWGVEVFFRMIKQNLERAKLHSRTPKNVIIELDWTMLAIWYSLYTARACITPGEKLSGMKAFRVFFKLIIRVATHSVLRSNHRAELSGSVAANESGRKSEKNSRAYPRKKKKRQTGEPTINDLSDELWKKADAMLA
ncbi:MAG TPA: IS4 family transposase [Pirellulaceae bacterium]|nr:IS4 family transposase [Pirellulaceae bacterium]